MGLELDQQMADSKQSKKSNQIDRLLICNNVPEILAGEIVPSPNFGREGRTQPRIRATN